MRKKKNIYRISSIIKIALLVILASCTEPIDVELQNIDPAYVIEGKVSNIKDSLEIDISLTNDYYEAYANNETSVNSVIIIAPGNDTIILTEVSTGKYRAPYQISGFNQTYSLQITTNDNDKIYSSSTMPTPVLIDSVKIEDYELEYWDTAWSDSYDLRDTLSVTIYFKDPAEMTNYYRFKYYVNDTLKDDLDYIADDYYFSGVTYPLEYSTKFNTEDKVFIELIQYDSASYEFFNTMFLSMQQDNGGTPFNPHSNLESSIDVYGYFAAYASDTVTVPFKYAAAYMKENNLSEIILTPDEINNLPK